MGQWTFFFGQQRNQFRESENQNQRIIRDQIRQRSENERIRDQRATHEFFHFYNHKPLTIEPREGKNMQKNPKKNRKKPKKKEEQAPRDPSGVVRVQKRYLRTDRASWGDVRRRRPSNFFAFNGGTRSSKSGRCCASRSKASV